MMRGGLDYLSLATLYQQFYVRMANAAVRGIMAWIARGDSKCGANVLTKARPGRRLVGVRLFLLEVLLIDELAQVFFAVGVERSQLIGQQAVSCITHPGAFEGNRGLCIHW
jgi:hypothetical protein